jgi:Arylsulfatase A and related enzymes
MKGSSFEGGFRVPAIAWWPGHIKPGTVNMDMWSHMDWWPTLAKLAGLEPPPHDWKDNDGNPIIFDGIDLSESLLGTGLANVTILSISTTRASAAFGSRTSRRSTPPRIPGSDRSNP